MNRKRLRFSLVIPAYNEARHLVACLDSVAAQTVMPDEVIVVDNNSTDATAKIAGRYPFVTVVAEPKQGIVYARNAGFTAAAGDIIGRIDADSVLPDFWVAYLQDFFTRQTKAVAWTGGGYFYNVRFAGAVSWLYNLLCFRFNQLLTGFPSLWGSNMAVRREHWQAVSGAVCGRADIHEDLDLAFHLRAAGCGIFYDTKVKTMTHMRRVRSNRHELWDYLQWWPRTLRLHGVASWPLCWLVGCLLIYAITPVLVVGEKVARSWGLRPIPEDSSPERI